MVNQHWSIEVLSLPINKVTITNTTQHSKLSSVDLLTESIQTSLQGNPKSFSEPTTQQTSFTKALYIQQRPIPKSSFQRLYKKTPTSLLNIPSQASRPVQRPLLRPFGPPFWSVYEFAIHLRSLRTKTPPDNCTNSQFACEAYVQKPLRQYESSTGILEHRIYSIF